MLLLTSCAEIKASNDPLDFDVSVEEDKGDRQQKRPQQKSAKRKHKDTKFGFGGGKKYAKSNTADSAKDMKGFSLRANKKPFAGAAKVRPSLASPLSSLCRSRAYVGQGWGWRQARSRQGGQAARKGGTCQEQRKEIKLPICKFNQKKHMTF